MIFPFFPRLRLYIFLFILVCAVVFSTLSFFFPQVLEKTLDTLSERYPAIAAYREALQYDYDSYEVPERYEREYDVDDSDYAYDDYDNDYDYDLSR